MMLGITHLTTHDAKSETAIGTSQSLSDINPPPPASHEPPTTPTMQANVNPKNNHENTKLYLEI